MDNGFPRPSRPPASGPSGAPSATDFRPSLTIAFASTVGGVAGHQRTSEVVLPPLHHLGAHVFEPCPQSRSLWRHVPPIFRMAWGAVTLNRTTFRPFGPSVTFLTALARMSSQPPSSDRGVFREFDVLGGHRVFTLQI